MCRFNLSCLTIIDSHSCAFGLKKSVLIYFGCIPIHEKFLLSNNQNFLVIFFRNFLHIVNHLYRIEKWKCNWESSAFIRKSTGYKCYFRFKSISNESFSMKKPHFYFVLICLWTRVLKCFWQVMILANVHVNTTKNT